MPSGIENFSAVCIILTPALIYLAYAWSRTSRTLSQHQLLMGLSAGVGSILIAVVLALPAHLMAVGESPLVFALVMALPGSGINEELAKALICGNLIFRKKTFQEPGEALLLCMLIGFSFALFENIGYLTDSKGAIEVAYIRALTATMMHLSRAVLMGAAVIHTLRTGSYMPFGLMVVGQMLLHASYNFPLLYLDALVKSKQTILPELIVVNGTVLVISVILSVVALNKSGLQSSHRQIGDQGNVLVRAGGVILVVIGLMTAGVLSIVSPGNEFLQKVPLQIYLSFCGPPLVLGTEMVLNSFRACPVHATCRSVYPVQVVSRRVAPRRFSRRTGMGGPGVG